MENEATTKTPIPTRSGFRNFPLCTCLHPHPLGLIFAFSTYLSCHEFIASDPPFLSMDYFSVFSAFSVAISFVPLCLSGHESIMQNKPNFLNDKTNANLFMAKVYENKPPRPTQKNKANQTQFRPHPNPHFCADVHLSGVHFFSSNPPRKAASASPLFAGFLFGLLHFAGHRDKSDGHHLLTLYLSLLVLGDNLQILVPGASPKRKYHPAAGL